MSDVRVSHLIATRALVDALKSRFSCRRCGYCCTQFRGVEVSQEEMRRLDVRAADRSRTFMTIKGQHYLKQPCPYYDQEAHACTNYENRPDICRAFPVHTWVCDDGRRHLGVSEKCEAGLAALAEVEVDVATGVLSEEG